MPDPQFQPVDLPTGFTPVDVLSHGPPGTGLGAAATGTAIASMGGDPAATTPGEVLTSTLPSLAAMGTSMALGPGVGLGVRIGAVGLAGAAGEAYKQISNRLMGVPDQPKTSGEAALRIGATGAIVAGTEGLSQLISRGVGHILQSNYVVGPEYQQAVANAKQLGFSGLKGEAMVKSTDQAIGSALDAITTSKQAPGGPILDALDLGKQVYQNAVSDNFNTVRKLVGTNPVGWNDVAQKARDLAEQAMARMQPYEKLSPDVNRILTSTSIGNVRSWDQAQSLRSNLIDMASSGDRTIRSVGKQLLGPVTDAMQAAADKAGAGEAYVFARDFMGDNAQKIFGGRYVSQVTRAEPEMVVDSVLKSPARASEVLQALDFAKDGTAKDLLRKNAILNTISTPTGEINYRGLSDALAKNSAVLDVLSKGDPAMTNAIDTLNKLGTITSRVPEFSTEGSKKGMLGATAVNVLDGLLSISIARPQRIPYDISRAFARPMLARIVQNPAASTAYLNGVKALVDGDAGVAGANVARAVEIAMRGSKLLTNSERDAVNPPAVQPPSFSEMAPQ